VVEWGTGRTRVREDAPGRRTRGDDKGKELLAAIANQQKKESGAGNSSHRREGERGDKEYRQALTAKKGKRGRKMDRSIRLHSVTTGKKGVSDGGKVKLLRIGGSKGTVKKRGV